jgi:hypothetical protein
MNLKRMNKPFSMILRLFKTADDALTILDYLAVILVVLVLVGAIIFSIAKVIL